MKVIASVLLAFSLLVTGLPMTGQASAWASPKAAAEGQAMAGQETRTHTEEKKDRETKAEPEGKQPEAIETEPEGKQPEAIETEPEDKQVEAAKTEPGDKGEDEPDGAQAGNVGDGQQESLPESKEEKNGEKKGKGKKEEGGAKAQEKETADPEEGHGSPGKEEEGQPLEREEMDRQAPPTVTLQQDGNTKNLVLKTDELNSFDPGDSPQGYHTEISRKIVCKHTAAAINASVKCKKASSPLKPSNSDLTGGVVLTGKLRGKRHTARVENFDAGGRNNTVSHLRLKVTVNAGGIKNQDIELAYPYVCGDGYAGYAYIENHFAYCPNTDKFYTVASSHVWLGCTRGDDGSPEFHPSEYKHEFNVYKEVANKYKVVYKANGGTGSANAQNATYGRNLTLNKGTNFKYTGYTLTGWNTKSNGSGRAYELGEVTKNLTTRDGGTVELYAQWTPNTLTVEYDGNGGRGDRNAPQSIMLFCNYWNYATEAKDPEDISSFGLTRTGYSRKVGAEWNTRADGTGKSFAENQRYNMTDYAPDLATGSRTITLYAQWEPNIYTITLDHQLEKPDHAGTPMLYDKYDTGIFFDSGCTRKFTSEEGKIDIPRKKGYQFIGYYGSKMTTSSIGKRETGRKINADGTLEPEKQSFIRPINDTNRTWYAWYDYLVACEDYADIPCDLSREEGDVREDIGVKLSYDPRRRTATVDVGRPGCMVSFTGQPSGTKVGAFTSTVGPGSATGGTGRDGKAQITILAGVPEGAAYRLEVTKNGETLHDRMVYYQGGRFRTLARLGVQEAKPVSLGGSISGSAWGTDEAYGLYRYYGCTEIENVKEPGTVQRYFRYKDVNMAYSGNGATAGSNILEYDVSLENFYQFRNNGFQKEQIEKKYTVNNKPYECRVRYSFQGWEMEQRKIYNEKQQEMMTEVYDTAQKYGVISDHPMEDISTYQEMEPVFVLPGLNGMGTYQTSRGAQGTWEKALQAKASGNAHAEEYINFTAKWDAFPTIVVTPGEKLEFYEGEEVTKEDLIRHLTAHDNEDNHKNNKPYVANLNKNLRIVKIAYPESANRSQGAYEKTYEKDVPEDFRLDTYYLKLEEDESVDVLVTFAVTDQAGNTTEEEIPVKVKYNHYPEISSEDIFYYLKEEANRGEITAEALIGRAQARDREDGDITAKLALKDFEEQVLKMQTESKAEFDVTYQVTDAYRKTTYKTVKVMVWDEDASIAQMPKYYVRYISEKHLDTLEEGSAWREPENLAYLKAVLNNGTPMETWDFSYEDIRAVQDWITGDGGGHWKVGQAANREFLARFAYCRQ